MKRIDFKYVGILFLGVISSSLIHEFGHFITGFLLENEMGMTLNVAYPVTGSYLESWHYPIVVSAGPIFTIIQAIVALSLIYIYGPGNLFYAFLIGPVTLRVWPYLVSPVMQQDEAIISNFLGMAPLILPVVTWLLLGVIAWIGSKKINTSGKFVFTTVLLILIIFQIVLRSNNFVVSLLSN